MKGQDTMKTGESIAHATVSLFEAGDWFFMFNPKGAANFCVCALKPLDHIAGYALRVFCKHPSKI